MRKFFLLFIILLALPFVCGQIVDSSNLRVTLVNQEPDPVEPGNIVDVRFKIENLGSATLDDVSFEVVPEFPFSALPGDNITQSIGNVWGRQVSETGVIVLFKLKVDESAVSGDNDLKVRFKSKNGAWYQPEAFTIRVGAADKLLLVSKVETFPEQIVPGEPSKLRLTLDNQAGGIIRNVIIFLNLTSSEVPIAPVGSMSEQKISSISANSKKEIDFGIVALSDASAGIYKVPLLISYSDDSGNNYFKGGIISILVGDKPDLVIQASSDVVKSAKSSGNVKLTFTNKGLSNIKFLNVIVNENDDVKVYSAPEVYVGSVDSDDNEVAEFNLYVGKAKDGVVMIPLTLEFRDANNKLFVENRDVPLRVFSGSDLRRVSGGANWLGMLIVLLIVGGGLFWYFRRKRHKK